MACYCCVLGCRNNNHKPTTKHFFRFPKNDEKRRKLWKRFARKNIIKQTAVICEDHFESRFMVQKDKKLKLTGDAVPTLYLKKTKEGIQQTQIDYSGDDYVGKEAEELNKLNEVFKNQEIVAMETAFVNEQLKLDEIKTRCRFCAEAKEELIDVSSFTTYNIDIDIFLRFLGLHIIESDFFPNSVCEECFNQVILLDTFIVKCKSADGWLWDELQKLKTISAAVAKPDIISAESPENSNVLTSQVDEENFEETLEESYESSVNKYESGNEEIFKTEPAFESNEFDEQPAKTKCLETVQDAIMDPSCNKFAMKSYNCDICLKVFAGLKTYKNHVCDVPLIQCSDCGDIFETVFAMKSHRRHLHSGKYEKNYCPMCKTVITGKQVVFKKHKAKCNRNRISSIQCEMCPQVRQ